MTCTLCDLPTPDPPVTDESVQGEFCCRGCLAVARTLAETDGQVDGEADPETARAALAREDEGGSEQTDAGADAETDAQTETAHLVVEGMHCATCEAYLESVATDGAGVRGAEASYATGTMRLTYDPEVVSAADLPAAVSGAGYRARLRDPEGRTGDPDATGRLLVGGLFGMMTMVWYALFLYPAYLGVDPSLLVLDVRGPAGRYLLWNVAVMATLVVGYTGFPLLRGAYVSLRAGQPNMDLLVALAAVTATAYSTLALLLGRVEVYYDVAVVVVLAVTVGNHYEKRVRDRATGRLADLATRRVDTARRRVAGDTETVAVDDLAPGESVVVRAGERVPVDGTVAEGTGAVDESLVTGESRPRRVEAGDDVVGGSLLADGGVVVEVGPDATSTLDRLVGLLWEAQTARPGVQRVADRLASVFVPLVVALAAAATGWHLLAGAAPAAAVLTGLTVLVVSCPCALGLATPLAVAAAVRDALDAGVVVTGSAVFERAGDVDVVALDKTGTLTTGAMAVRGVTTDGDTRAETLLQRAGAVETLADHPVADAIASSALQRSANQSSGERGEPRDSAPRSGAVQSSGDHREPRGSALQRSANQSSGDHREPRGSALQRSANQSSGDQRDPRDSAPAAEGVADFERHPGRGASGVVDGTRVVVGSRDLFDAEGWAVPDALAARTADARADGQVPSLVGWDGRARGVVVAGDAPREEWEGAVSELGAGREVVVLTGDDERAAARFAEHPAVDDVFADVRPAAKTAVVERLREGGRRTVAMVGDGVNDAPALGAADLGVAMADRTGTRLAADAADAVVTGGDLDAVPRVFDLTTATRRRIRENLGWALCYNAVALPLAVTGLLNPLFAAVAMAASSLLVVANSARSLL